MISKTTVGVLTQREYKRRARMSIGVNPGGRVWGCHDPQNLGWGDRGGRETLLYLIMYRKFESGDFTSEIE